MLNQSLVIARKEIVDGLRDIRSVIASLLYALMGPLVVGLVSMAHPAGAKPGSSAGVLVGMMSVFTLVAAFVGGMNVAMDTVAGERERRSLLPLLLNPVRRWNLVLGKWLAVSLFAIARLSRQPGGICASLCDLGDAGERSMARSLVRHGLRDLSPAALRRLDPIAHFNRLPRREGSADLAVADRVSSHGHRDAARVLPGGEASLVRLPPRGGTTVAARTPDGWQDGSVTATNSIGMRDRDPGPACLTGCRQQVAA